MGSKSRELHLQLEMKSVHIEKMRRERIKNFHSQSFNKAPKERYINMYRLGISIRKKQNYA